jgi:hypothetical protein
MLVAGKSLQLVLDVRIKEVHLRHSLLTEAQPRQAKRKAPSPSVWAKLSIPRVRLVVKTPAIDVPKS